MLVFLLEVKEVTQDVMTCVETYNFIIAKDWWGIDELLLCFGVEKSLTISNKMFLEPSFLFLCIYCVQVILC